MEYLTENELKELLDKSEIEHGRIAEHHFNDDFRWITLGSFVVRVKGVCVHVYCKMEKESEGVELRISFKEHKYYIVKTEGYTKRKVFNLIIKELKYLKDIIDKYLIKVEEEKKEEEQEEQEYQEKMQKLAANGKIVFNKYHGYKIKKENDNG